MVSVVGTEAKAPWLLLPLLMLLKVIPEVCTVESSNFLLIDCWDSCVVFFATMLLFVLPFEGSIMVELALSDINVTGEGLLLFRLPPSLQVRMVARFTAAAFVETRR